ncbi:MAG: 30S ribosomal protein S17 [Actinobacteria bacterium]|jgi:small subunit ribosomal protein S17|nr:30S ribosomal protein S17 [Actinomycetota bacterium]MCZ6518326.1 30S ribosomal protein S17 [Actinomycetota bacterium]MCZ6568501.1 30S ribosomal protein S17 [Actinomycetota bacterium]MCZ6631013.1 30S ribosomal protein S17 [Actinomycetota bacterium]MCZ6736640.1 30S ribosomal protein S17 [Actinomycetota bacterium]
MADNQTRKRRKVRVGVVVSDSRDKTITVEVPNLTAHPRYDKVVRRSTKFHVHDETNDAHLGDKVEIMETRPVSKQKRWRLIEIVERAR